MTWLIAGILGALGGLLVELAAVADRVLTWQKTRHEARSMGGALPSLRECVDPSADSVAALTRIMIGAVAGIILHNQVTGEMAAIAVGASAPALFQRLAATQSLTSLGEGKES